MSFPWVTEKHRRKAERELDDARWKATQCSIRINTVRQKRTMEDILADQATRNVLRPAKTRFRPASKKGGEG